MKAQVVRYKGRYSADPVNRLIIPSKRLVVSPDKHVEQRTMKTGQPLGQAVDIGPDLVQAVERILHAQDALDRLLRSRRYRGLGQVLSL